MSLVGVPVLVAALLGVAGTLAVTVAVWNRPGRLVLRPLGVLLTEAFLLLSVGLVVNRSEQFFPTWSSLSGRGTAATGVATAAPGRLDRWLDSQPAARAGAPDTFAWRPDGWWSWHLATAPVVTVPAGYLQHPRLRYPVILVLGGRPAPPVTAAVTVLLSPTAATLVTGSLPAAVEADLRVTGYRWAVVTDPAHARLARAAATTSPARFSVVATAVPAAARELPPPLAGSAPVVGWLPPARPRPSRSARPPAAPSAIRHVAR